MAEESKLEKRIANYCKENNWLYYKFVSPAKNGVPDRIMIKSGIIIFIELKSPGKPLRKLQEVRFKELQTAGAQAYKIDNYENFLDLIKQYEEKITKIKMRK